MSLILCMKINSLELISFRNYHQQSFLFDPYINIFIGDNAQGKTNVLESIYLLSTARSFRTHKYKEMIFFNEEFSKITGQVETNNKPSVMRIVLSKEGKKAFINQKDILKTSEYLGYLNVILFLPSDLYLIQGSPGERRSLLDSEISKISPIYMYNISKYYKLLKERNAYLKSLHDHKKEADVYLEVLSEQLAGLQEDIIKIRYDFISLLDEISHKIYDYISSSESLSISYHCMYKDYSKEIILKKYQETYYKDIIYSMTSFGLHRDDIIFKLNDKNAAFYASQGQQRSIVLALKIGLLEIAKKQIGEYPILLLDDVLSELDDKRKTKLLNMIDHKIQTFITSTSIDGIHHQIINDALKIYISEGHIKEEKNGRYKSKS